MGGGGVVGGVWVGGGGRPPAALAVIVTSSFSAKDLLLNLLAVAFITEADDMLAMILSPAARRRPDKALEEMRQSGVVVDGMVFARFIALLCSVSIVWFVVDTESILNTLGSILGGTGCSAMDAALGFYAAFGAFISMFLHLLVHWVSLCASTTKCKAALLAWSDGFYDVAVFCFAGGVLFAFMGIALEDVWSRLRFILQNGGGAVGSGCISAALQACANRRAKKPKEPEFEF